MPNHVACASCNILHKVNVADTPTSRYPVGRCMRGVETRDHRYEVTWHGSADNFRLVYNHVQLALKYTRLTNTHTEYLAELMKPYAFCEDKGDRFPPSRSGSSLLSLFSYHRTETPKIVDGRYLLESVVDIRSRDVGPIQLSKATWLFPRVCSMHWDTTVGSITLPTGESMWDTNFYMPSSLILFESFSCDTCRTDFQFELSSRRWTVRMWRVFGTETEPVHERWRYGNERTCTERRTEPLRPGPIEAMYNIR